MAKYRLTGTAKKDLSDIVRYTQKHWGQSQTNIYITSLEDSCQLLADNPGIGKQCNDIVTGLLSYPVNSHVIYYLRQDCNIAILRILHQRMLPNKYL